MPDGALGPSTARRWEDMSTAEQLAVQDEPTRAKILASYTEAQLEDLKYDWTFWGRPKQLAPKGDWSTWLLRAGRGFGKTRGGVGWIQSRAMDEARWIALVGATPADVRDYMIEGPGGFLDPKGVNIAPKDRPLFEPSKRRLTWPNGSWATIYSAEEPGQLRGYSGDTAWLDELGKYPKPRLVWDNLQFGMREASSDRPRRLITTTPTPDPIFRELARLPGTVEVIGSSYENRANLDPTWFAETILAYEGTQIGRQEIHAELLDPEEGGIVKRSSFRIWPHDRSLPTFEAIVVSLDTAFTERTQTGAEGGDPTACQVWGLFRHERRPALMVLDCWAEHLGFPELIERARREMKTAYGAPKDEPLIRPMIPAAWDTIPSMGRRPDLLLIEDKGSGISLRQTLAREGIHSYPYNPGKADKLLRLHLVSHVFQQRMVWLVGSEHPARTGQPKAWYGPMLEQLCSFRGDGSIEHDDHVDAATQAVRYFLDRHLLTVTTPPLQEDVHAAVTRQRGYGAPRINNPYAT